MIEKEIRVNEIILQSIDLIHTKIDLRQDGIVQLTTAENFMFTIKETIEGVDAVGKLTSGKLAPVLKIAGVGASVDSESRKYIASGEGARFSIAEAIVIQSLAQKLIGNFYLNVEKPIKPTKLFNDKEAAIKWLQQYTL